MIVQLVLFTRGEGTAVAPWLNAHPPAWRVLAMISGTLILILMVVVLVVVVMRVVVIVVVKNMITLILRRNKSISQRAAMVRLITIVGRAYAIQVAYLNQIHHHHHRHHHCRHLNHPPHHYHFRHRT